MKKIMIVLALAVNLFAETSNYVLRRACHQGDAWRCAMLGIKDERQKACDGGDAWRCALLGAMRNDVKGFKQDYFKAAELYQKACDGGVAWGCITLGWMYEEGEEGVKQNKTKAKELYGKACDMKSQDGCERYKRLNEAGY